MAKAASLDLDRYGKDGYLLPRYRTSFDNWLILDAKGGKKFLGFLALLPGALFFIFIYGSSFEPRRLGATDHGGFWMGLMPHATQWWWVGTGFMSVGLVFLVLATVFHIIRPLRRLFGWLFLQLGVAGFVMTLLWPAGMFFGDYLEAHPHAVDGPASSVIDPLGDALEPIVRDLIGMPPRAAQ